MNLLSELPKRMARVSLDGSPSEISAWHLYTQLLSDPILGWSFISGVTAEQFRTLNVRDYRSMPLTQVIRADLQCLVTAHHQSNLFVLLVGKQTKFASATLFPLSSHSVKPEEFCTPIKLQGQLYHNKSVG